MAELHVVHDNGVNDKSLYAADNENSSIDDLRRQMQEFAESTNSKFECIETELNNLKARLVPLFVMEAAVKELRKDKDSLLKENAELREKNLNYALITSDLNSKVKEHEHEKDSLVTAMKLQQQELEQGHYKRGNDQATQNFKSNNSYSVLNDEANTQNSDLHASVIEIDSTIQQPSFGRNTVINNNISPEHGDIANNYTELTDETIQGMKDSSSSATESRNQLNDQDQTSTRNGDNSYDKLKPVLIIGDSIIKHIDPRKHSKK